MSGTTLNFKKYGFIRTPENDFSDDGNRFKAYDYKGIEFSYLKAYGEVYLSGRFSRTYDKELLNKELAELGNKIISILDRYNGVGSYLVDNETLESYKDDVDYVITLIDKYNSLVNDIREVIVYQFQNMQLVKIYKEEKECIGWRQYKTIYKEKLENYTDNELERQFSTLEIKKVELIVK